jgi:hypothetical protein
MKSLKNKIWSIPAIAAHCRSRLIQQRPRLEITEVRMIMNSVFLSTQKSLENEKI